MRLGLVEVHDVIHVAGFKSVRESFNAPLRYLNTNVSGRLDLLEAMKENNCRDLVFSSSASTYGQQRSRPNKKPFL